MLRFNRQMSADVRLNFPEPLTPGAHETQSQ